MTFKRISLHKYIDHHLRLNPTADRRDLEMKLNRALQDHQNGITCHCGDDIWVIGSAFLGNGCFTCLTGEHAPYDDYELDTAHHKSSHRKGQVHIDDMDPDDIHGLFDDEGYKINTELIKKPGLCLLCIHDHDPGQEMACSLIRIDQQEKMEFTCHAFKKSL